VFNSLGAAMPKRYNWSYYNEGTNKWIETDTEYTTNLYLPHRKTKDGRISLSHTESLDGDSIADVLSQMMNGLVDVEKDAWIFFIQGNLEIAPTLLYLIKAGVPKEHAIMFVSNPLVREYAKNQRLYKSSYANVAGKTLDKKQYAQYQAATDVIRRQTPLLASQALENYIDSDILNVKIMQWNDETGELEYPVLTMTKGEIIDKLRNDKRFFEDQFLSIMKGKTTLFKKP
jgi:hypothetical protein